MLEIIDLSQEIFTGMPVFPGLPEVKITVHQSHEELEGVADGGVVSPAVNRLELGEHTGTHVDAINHMGREYRGQSIDTMPLTTFYTEGICLDLSHKGLRELIEPVESVQEYQVITLLAPAQFGRNLGAQVNAVSRSGGREFHGALYGLFSPSRLNARDFFDTANGDAETPLLADARPVVVAPRFVFNQSTLNFEPAGAA
jgi:hypothetical protein